MEQLRMEMVSRVNHARISVALAAREAGLSRQTCYKWLAREKKEGVKGLANRAGRSGRPLELSAEAAAFLIDLKHRNMTFGPKKLLAELIRKHGNEAAPSLSTVCRLMRKHGLTESKGRGRPRRVVTSLEATLACADAPNQLWTLDFKGHWLTRDGKRCGPLTVQDSGTRYLLMVRPLARGDTECVREALVELFERYGMPERVRFDNGSPFASTSGPLGLSRLGAWLVMLGIRVERMRPGHPEENARHERMHGELELSLTPGRWTLAEEAKRLEAWRNWYNGERPHEGIDQQRPGDLYRGSPRRWCSDQVRWQYPEGFETRQVRRHGQIKLAGREVFLSEALRGFEIGLELLLPASSCGSSNGVTEVAKRSTVNGRATRSVNGGRGSHGTGRPAVSTEKRWRVWFCGLQLGELAGGALEAA